MTVTSLIPPTIYISEILITLSTLSPSFGVTVSVEQLKALIKLLAEVTNQAAGPGVTLTESSVLLIKKILEGANRIDLLEQLDFLDPIPLEDDRQLDEPESLDRPHTMVIGNGYSEKLQDCALIYSLEAALSYFSATDDDPIPPETSVIPVASAVNYPAPPEAASKLSALLEWLNPVSALQLALALSVFLLFTLKQSISDSEVLDDETIESQNSETSPDPSTTAKSDQTNALPDDEAPKNNGNADLSSVDPASPENLNSSGSEEEEDGPDDSSPTGDDDRPSPSGGSGDGTNSGTDDSSGNNSSSPDSSSPSSAQDTPTPDGSSSNSGPGANLNTRPIPTDSPDNSGKKGTENPNQQLIAQFIPLPEIAEFPFNPPTQNNDPSLPIVEGVNPGDQPTPTTSDDRPITDSTSNPGDNHFGNGQPDQKPAIAPDGSPVVPTLPPTPPLNTPTPDQPGQRPDSPELDPSVTPEELPKKPVPKQPTTPEPVAPAPVAPTRVAPNPPISPSNPAPGGVESPDLDPQPPLIAPTETPIIGEPDYQPGNLPPTLPPVTQETPTESPIPPAVTPSTPKVPEPGNQPDFEPTPSAPGTTPSETPHPEAPGGTPPVVPSAPTVPELANQPDFKPTPDGAPGTSSETPYPESPGTPTTVPEPGNQPELAPIPSNPGTPHPEAPGGTPPVVPSAPTTGPEPGNQPGLEPIPSAPGEAPTASPVPPTSTPSKPTVPTSGNQPDLEPIPDTPGKTPVDSSQDPIDHPTLDPPTPPITGSVIPQLTYIDFSLDGLAKTALVAGDIIFGQFNTQGVNISVQGGETNQGMIFDGRNITGGDFDLAFDGNLLIISEDGNSTDPDDDALGGSISFEFDSLTNFFQAGVLDVEGPGSYVEYRRGDELLATTQLQGLGDNSHQFITAPTGIEFDEAIVYLNTSGGITEFSYGSLPQGFTPPFSTTESWLGNQSLVPGSLSVNPFQV